MRPAVLLLLLVATAWALSPDLLATQWRHENLGRVCDACISSTDSGVITWAGTSVAALDGHGRIKWRRASTCPVARAAGSCVTLHYADGRLSQSTNGAEDWAVSEAQVVAGAISTESGWIVYGNSELWIMSSKGVKQWRTPFGQGEEIANVVSSQHGTVVVTWMAGAALTGTVDVKTGSVSPRVPHTLSNAAVGKSATVLGGAVLIVLDTKGTLHDAPLSGTGDMRAVASIAEIEMEGDTRLVSSSFWTEAALVSTSADPLKASRLRRITLTSQRASVSEVRDGTAAATADAALIFEITGSNNVSIWFDSRLTSSLSLAGPATLAQGARLLLPLRSPSGPVVVQQRTALQLDLFTADSASSRFRRVWSRDEALSQVLDAIFVDLAAPPHSHLLDIFGASLGSGQKEETGGLKQEEYRDRYGLRKQAILLTSTNSLHSLATDGGAQLWRTVLPLAPNVQAKWARVFYSRVSASVIVVIATERFTVLASVSPSSGAFLSDPEIIYGAPAMHAAAFRGFVYVVDGNGNAFAYPRTSPALSSDIGSQLYFVLHDKSSVRGYGLRAAETGRWAAEERWRHVAGVGEEVQQVLLSDEGDVSASSVKVRSNGTVMHKSSLAPSSVLVLTYNASAASLMTSLVHVPTGASLHSAVYRGAAHPISAVKSEHWYTVLFWDTRAHRQVLHINELFKRSNAAVQNRTPFEWFMAWAFSGDDASSHTEREPIRVDSVQALSQSYYVMPGSFSTVRALGVTHSHSGVANKLVLLGGASGQLLGLEKRILDVRRVPREKWTAMDQEEGLIPYNSSLLLAPRTALFSRPTSNLRFVRSAAARLESTSHVLAVGDDLMYTHVMPAGPFDRLSPDFNRVALVGTLAGLCLFTLILSMMKRNAPPK